MSRVCILSDSTAQFTRPNFPGRERVFVASFGLEPALPPGRVPPLERSIGSHLIPPSRQDFRDYYERLSTEYESILVLTVSSQLSPAASHALAASAQVSNPVKVEVLDTRTISVGLGWLVELAAGAAAAGESAGAIIRQVRLAAARIYTLFFIPNLGPLSQAGLLSPAQALVAGMLGMLPIFMLENGQLVPLEKAHTQRAVLEYFEEFLDEFEYPEHVALVHGTESTRLRTSSLREHIQENHPGAHFSDLAFSSHLEALLGAQSISMAIMQKG